MLSNRLQLNTAKTQILWCSTNRWQNHLPSAAVRVGENYVLPLTTVRDLGVLIDSNVAMRSHVSRTVSGCFAVLRQLRSIRRSVSDSMFHSLVVSLVMPRLDYCNATLAHRSSRYEHVTPILRDLHWLRSPERIDFKLAVLTYRCLAPRYLSDYIQSVAVSNRRRLRSSSFSQLVIRRTRLSTVGDLAFPATGCRLSFNAVCF